MSKSSLSRRYFLRGLGTAIALPTMESLVPGAGIIRAAENKSVSALSKPIRMAFVYMPNGVIMDHWTPKSTGEKFDLPKTLSPLEAVRGDLQILTGLAHEKANANGDGGGDHARANATFLTGCQARKTAGADIHVGKSVDQMAADVMGQFTRLPSLELSCDEGRKAGSCDSGYSCSYQYNLAWKSETSPMTPERDPRLVFDRLFSNEMRGEVAEQRAKRDLYNKSILDFVREDTQRMSKYLGRSDRDKMDEYLTTIRELERQIEGAEKYAAKAPDYDRPSGIPKTYEEHIRVMFDIMSLAFQTDTTRISTFLMAHDGSNRSFNEVGVSDGHHGISHHQNNQEKKDKLQKIDQFYVTQFAYFLERMKSIPEGDGTLLDNCMIVLGGGISDGNRHQHTNLPVLLAGKGGGSLKTGRHVSIEQTPMTNLYLSMLETMGVDAKSIGDSTGKLRGLTA